MNADNTTNHQQTRVQKTKIGGKKMTLRQAKFYDAKAKKLKFHVFAWATYAKWSWSLSHPYNWPSQYYRFPGDNTGEYWIDSIHGGEIMRWKKSLLACGTEPKNLA